MRCHREAERRAFAPFACLMSMYSNAHGKKATPEDFMPKDSQRKAQNAPGALGPEVFYAFQEAFSANEGMGN